MGKIPGESVPPESWMLFLQDAHDVQHVQDAQGAQDVQDVHDVLDIKYV